MKIINKIITTAAAFCILQSCAVIKDDLPMNLPKSLLLVQKMDEVPVAEKGLAKFATKIASKTATRFNNALVSNFAAYPFEYKIVSKDEIGDNLVEGKQVFLLRNGSTTITRGTQSSTSKTEVILEDLVKNRKKEIAYLSGGVAKVGKAFTKKAKKQFASKIKKSK